MRPMTLLVTGASGFIGKNLVSVLAKSGVTKVLVRRTSNIESFKGKNEIEILYGELETNQGIEEALTGVDAVIHCAARTIGKNFIEYYQTNTIGTVNLIKAMNKKNVEKILYLSSHAACGPCYKEKPLKETDKSKPVSFYGITKKLAEEIINRSGLKYTILRPVSVYGPYDTDILRYIRLLNHRLCPIVGFGEKYINLIYVVDLVQLIITIIKRDEFANRTYFVNDGNCYSYEKILNEIANILNKKHLKIFIPEPIALFYALLNDIFLPQQKRFIWRDKVKELAKNNWLCCNEELIANFNFTPKYTLEQGMRETINWYQNNGYLK